MKVSSVTNYSSPKYKNNVNFGAYKSLVNDNGEKEHSFYLAYDTNRFKAFLELFEAKDEKGKWSVKKQPIATFELPKEGMSVSMDELSEFPVDKLAYRYRLSSINASEPDRFMYDNGTKSEKTNNEEIEANILYADRAIFSKPLIATLIMPDMYHRVTKDIKTDRTIEGFEKGILRNHVNMLGGNLQGIIKKLPELQQEGYTKIVGTPFTKDEVSSHKYWTQNAYQIASSLGTDDDFVALQQQLVEKGIGWIADGAFVNEGLQGVHFKSVLKWGEQSPFKDWFYISNQGSEPLTIGIFPEYQTEHVRFKLVNSKYKIEQNPKTKELVLVDNADYKKDEPTYVQFFDERLVPEGEKTSNTLITAYSILDKKTGFQIGTHDSSINPYYFEINPETLIKTVEDRNGYIRNHKDSPDADLQSIDTMKSIFSFENFRFDRKKVGGFVSWDGNVDIPKMNLHVSNSDIHQAENIASQSVQIKKDEDGKVTYEISSPLARRYTGMLQVKDYVNNAGKYWTGWTRDIQTEHVARLLGKSEDYYKKIEDLVSQGKLPKSILTSVTPEVVQNVVNEDYEYDYPAIGKKKDVILKAMESLPLDALGFSDELMASFSSPFISKRPFSENDKDMSRDEIAENKYENIPLEYRSVYTKFDEALRDKFLDYMVKVIDIANKDSGQKLYDANAQNPVVTPQGAEVIKMFVPQIFKKVLEMSIMINFADHPEEMDDQPMLALLSGAKNVTPQKLKINANSPEQEASMVVDKLIQGIEKISTDDDFAIKFRDLLGQGIRTYALNTDYTTHRLAKVIVDRGETGLGWRIDAAKDVANIDDVVSGIIRFDDAWDNVISVWRDFVKAVRQENPNAYITAELTDLNKLMATAGAQGSTIDTQKYKEEKHAEIAFFDQAGITSLANYKYFFSGIKDLYLPSSEDGSVGVKDQIEKLREKFGKPWKGNNNILDHGPNDAVKGAYNFYENHDKPRFLHTASLNMELFYGTFLYDNDNCYNGIVTKNREIAKNVFSKMGKTMTEADFVQVNNNVKSIAMADRLNKAINAVYTGSETPSKEQINGIKDEQKAFLDKFQKSTAEIAWGYFKGEKISNGGIFGVRPFDIALDMVFEQMEYEGYKFNDNEKEDYKKKLLTQILTPSLTQALRVLKIMITLPGMPTVYAGLDKGATGHESKSNNLYQQNRTVPNLDLDCIRDFKEQLKKILQIRNDESLSALTNGETILLPQTDNTLALFRYNDEGSKVISVYATNEGANLPHIQLTGLGEGIQGCLTPGMTFVNAENEADGFYKVETDDKGDSKIVKYDKNNQYQTIGITSAIGSALILKCVEGLRNIPKKATLSINGMQASITYKEVLKKAGYAIGTALKSVV